MIDTKASHSHLGERTMAALCRIPFSCGSKLFYFVCLIALGWTHPSGLHAQNTYAGCCPPYGAQDIGRPRITYGGRIFLSFPNYDVFLGGAPTRLEDLATGQGVQGPRVIYRNNQGMRFDGNEFFLHPAYPVEQITKYRYFNRVVGEPGATWLTASYSANCFSSCGFEQC